MHSLACAVLAYCLCAGHTCTCAARAATAEPAKESTPMAEFICLPISPFSRRAKWALDASGVPYKQTPWPMSTSYLGELPLRWRLGRLTGRITAPILLPDQQACKGLMMDSVAIAKWADEKGKARGTLFPAAAQEAITRHMTAVDAVQSYFRRQLAVGALADPAVRKKLLPGGMPTGLPWPFQQLLERFADYMGCKVMRRLVTKYPEDAAVTEEQARAALQSVWDALAASGSGYLLPTGFSFADIAWVTALEAMAPGDPFAAAAAAAPASKPGEAAAAAAAAADGGQAAGVAGDSSKAAVAPSFPSMMIPQLRSLMEAHAPLVAWKNKVLAEHQPRFK